MPLWALHLTYGRHRGALRVTTAEVGRVGSRRVGQRSTQESVL